jgi:hypothetical protein
MNENGLSTTKNSEREFGEEDFDSFLKLTQIEGINSKGLYSESGRSKMNLNKECVFSKRTGSSSGRLMGQMGKSCLQNNETLPESPLTAPFSNAMTGNAISSSSIPSLNCYGMSNCDFKNSPISSYNSATSSHRTTYSSNLSQISNAPFLISFKFTNRNLHQIPLIKNFKNLVSL